MQCNLPTRSSPLVTFLYNHRQDKTKPSLKNFIIIKKMDSECSRLCFRFSGCVFVFSVTGY